MAKEAIDIQVSTRWAMANVKSFGALGASKTTFDLFNVRTARAHRLVLYAGGFDFGFPVSFSPTSSMSGYTYFHTLTPVNFDDFNGHGAHLTAGSALLYSWTRLTLHKLADVRMSGWGVATPGIGIDNGVVRLVYGDGLPLGVVVSYPDLDFPIQELINARIQITVNEKQIVFVFPGDLLFDFDKDSIKPAVEPLLNQAALLIAATPMRRKVYFNGYTDAKGTDTYNVDLSMRRAKNVSAWFVSRGHLPAAQAEPAGYGKASPVAPNNLPNGADSPDGRAKNRRVEMVLILAGN